MPPTLLLLPPLMLLLLRTPQRGTPTWSLLQLQLL
jgi:hypothetical protein